MLKKVKIERTKKGLPALKVPLYIRRRGYLACAHHALFVVHEGDIVIQSSHHRGDFSHQVYRIVAIRCDEAELELLAEFSRGKWDTSPLGQQLEADLARMTAGEPPTMELSIAVQMAEGKATAYHCRSAYYGKREA